MTETKQSTPIRPVTMDDIQRMIGSMALELEILRRENAQLRQALENKNGEP